MSEAKSKFGWGVKISILLLMVVQMLQSTVNPSLTGIMQEFPGYDTTTYQTIINIATITECVAALVVGLLVRKIGFKTMVVIGCVLALAGSVTPVFFGNGVEIMIGIRAVFGVGYGIAYAIPVAAVGEFWEGKEATQMAGLITLFAGAAGIVFNLACSAIIAAVGDANWRMIYQMGWVIVPILILGLIFVPQRNPEIDKKAEELGRNSNVDFAGLGKDFWLLMVGVVLTLGAVCVFMNNIGMVVIGTAIMNPAAGLGDPAAAGASIGIIMTGFSVGLMLGGPIFIFSYNLLKRYAMPVYLLIDAVCFVLMIVAPGFITFTIWAAIIGVIFGCINSTWYEMMGPKCINPAAGALAGSLYVVVAGVAQFIGPFWMDFTAENIFQQPELDMVTFASGNPYYQYYPAIAVLVIGGVFLLFMAIKNHGVPDYEKKKEEAAADAA